MLPYQILLIVISAVNGIVDGIYASNAIGKTAMSAIGLYGPFNHFFYAASMLLVSGSQILYGRYISRERERIHSLFSSGHDHFCGDVRPDRNSAGAGRNIRHDAPDGV